MANTTSWRPSWRVALSYLVGVLTGLPTVVILLSCRPPSWAPLKGLGFLFAVIMSFGVGYGAAKILLKLPLYRSGFRPSPSGSWLDRPWGVVLQMTLLALAGAALFLL